MGFLKPNIPEPEKPIAAPTIDDPSVMRGAEDAAKRAAERRGAGDTILVPPRGGGFISAMRSKVGG